MWETIYNEAAWLITNTQKKVVLEGPAFVCNKKENRLQWVNLDGKLSDIPCSEQALHIWSENALANNPSDYNALYIKSYLLYRQSEYQSALKMINLALVFKPKNPWCALLKGDILFSLKDFDSAQEWYGRRNEREFYGLFVRQAQGVLSCNSSEFKDALFYLNKVDQKCISRALPANQLRVLHHHRGELFYAIGEYAKAREVFEKTLEIDPGDKYAKKRADESLHAQRNMSSVHWIKKCYALMEIHNFSHALECIDEALKIDPLNVKNLFLKTKALTSENKLSHALGVIDGILGINPENKNAQKEKLTLLRKRGDEESALRYAYEIFAVMPFDRSAYEAIVDIEYTRKGYESALCLIRDLLKLESLTLNRLREEADWMNVSCVNAAVMALTEIACADEILLREKLDYDALFIKGVSLAKLGRGNEALQCVDHYSAVYPQQMKTLVFKAWIFDKLQRYEEAIVWYKAALNQHPSLLPPPQERASLLERMCKLECMVGHYSHALATVEDLVEMRPKDRNALCLKGNILFLLGEYQKALICYETVLASSPQCLLALQGKAIYLFHRGFQRKSAQLFERIDDLLGMHNRGHLNFYPLVEVFNQRGLLFFALKEYALAEAVFEQTLSREPTNEFAQKYVADIKTFTQQAGIAEKLASLLTFFPSLSGEENDENVNTFEFSLQPPSP